MVAAPPKASRKNVELSKKILNIAQKRGMVRGDHLPEQLFATLCDVSRTPVRQAFQLLASCGVLQRDQAGRYRLLADPASTARLDETEPPTEDDDTRASILRDLVAGRLGEAQTVANLQRRYGVPRLAIQNALQKLAETQLVERGAGQHWRLKQFAVNAESIAKSYEFRLVMEPQALILPDFRCEPAALLALRHSMRTLQTMAEDQFDRRLFYRTDMDFHILLARSCGNPFLTEALINHHTRRFALPDTAHTGTFRLMRANEEHIQILEQVERGQMVLAADLMRVHIQQSQAIRPRLVGRGVPPTMQRTAR